MPVPAAALADPKAEDVRAYDLLHPGGGPGGDIARPAELLIDPSGTVRWRDLTEDYWVRARPEAVLEAFDRLSAPLALPGSSEALPSFPEADRRFVPCPIDYRVDAEPVSAQRSKGG